MRTATILSVLVALGLTMSAEAQVVVYSPVCVDPCVTCDPMPAVIGPAVVVSRPVIVYSPVVACTPSVVVRCPVARPYLVGRDIIGQPTFYVPGRPVRNTLRFLSP